jgi:hypothetical protein
MPSQKDNRAKGLQMTEQQPNIMPVTQDIVQMPPSAAIVQIPATQDIVQIPATQDIVQIPPTQDILQMAAQKFSRSNEPWEETDSWSLKNGTDRRETYDSGKMAQKE